MAETDSLAEEARETRLRIARHLAELHRLHLALAQDSRSLKRFTLAGRPGLEIDIAAELVEQYLGASDAFLENMRGRFEARLGLLRRGEPRHGPDPEDAPGHGAFWLAFSRLCAVLRRAGARLEG
ncbi:hypothetical protein [Paracraurococcus ruber]|uniref:Uncharacterized protein n=1 Tax=Paracraurococcus ruber TaxID=77675 RepID=A0ABS1CT50_9PROT|nr:hypothetical protein [Paracraurococcus ruber]MBK1657182.1 hypothetical protein [Paracraurococcus ruber]TDG31108.1 hypothetical protein E2C05_12000 [Paracraurococcus ruber]